MNEIAAILALIAAISFALAATLWQRASMDAGVEPGDAKGMVGLPTRWVWLLGLNPVVSVSLGAIVLQERLDSDPLWHWGVAVGALAITLFGAVIIAAASNAAPDPGDDAIQPALA